MSTVPRAMYGSSFPGLDCEDSCHSTSEAEPDSDGEDGGGSDPDDPQKLLQIWLGELDTLKAGLDNVNSGTAASAESDPLRPTAAPGLGEDQLYFQPPTIDSYRFSMAILEDSQDVELDAILGELCALESQFEQEIGSKPGTAGSGPGPAATGQGAATDGNKTQTPSIGTITQHRRTHSRSSSGGTRVKFDMNPLHVEVDSGNINANEKGLRTDSPDNDSAFSDNVSMLSSESSASSGASGTRTDVSKSSGASLSSSPTQFDQAARIKAEKIKVALEKIKEASIKKLFIKAFMQDGSTKSLLVDEKMTCAYITRLLAEKNHVRMDPKWAIVEHIPELYMERVYEDHELLVNNLMMWTRDSKNKILFLERVDKYDLFVSPEMYLLGMSSSEKDHEMDDDAKSLLLEEFFSSNGVGVPEVEGPLWLKSEGKKAWKKYYFVLRASGLYYCPKGKSKSSRDLVCLATFEVNQVYFGVGWKKKFKSPTDFCFAIKHPQLQSKATKFIKYLCAEDQRTVCQWVMGIRIAKHGQQLMENYRVLMEDLAQDDIDLLASARSFSVSSMATQSRLQSEATTPCSSDNKSLQLTLSSGVVVNEENVIAEDTSSLSGSAHDTPVNTLDRAHCRHSASRQDSIKSRGSSSSSSGCLSERSSNGTPTYEHAFDSDFPMGTIKRKPSMTPKIPLTTTTRLLVKEVEEAVDGHVNESGNVSRNSLRQSFRKSLTDEVNTVRRKSSVDQASKFCTKAVDVRTVKLETVESSPDLDTLPLPPPPEFSTNADNMQESDSESLPPPPPEAFRSNLSLASIDSLPPPPVPDVMTGSITSLSSLPPPPPPLQCLSGDASLDSLPTPPSSPCPYLENTRGASPQAQVQSWAAGSVSRCRKPSLPAPPVEPLYSTKLPGPQVLPKLGLLSPVGSLQRRASESDSSCTYSSPPYLAELKVVAMSPKSLRKGSLQHTNEQSIYSSPKHQQAFKGVDSNSTTTPKSPVKKGKKISFDDHVQVETTSPPPPPPPPKSKNYSKPPPPPRSENTKLTTASPVKKLSAPDSSVTPPKSFLMDLQRVMQKKWQVAQKFKVDRIASPQEVLGFRDHPRSSDYNESSVSAWVQEHYGGGKQPLGSSLYENVLDIRNSNCAEYQNYRDIPREYSRTVGGRHNHSMHVEDPRQLQTMPSKKKPPPPPPKRSETTQLSSRMH